MGNKKKKVKPLAEKVAKSSIHLNEEHSALMSAAKLGLHL